MEKINKKQGVIELKKVLDGCVVLLGSIKVRVEDLNETGAQLDVIRKNLAACSAYVETELVNAFNDVPDVTAELAQPVEEEALEEVLVDDGNDGESDSEPEPESTPADVNT